MSKLYEDLLDAEIVAMQWELDVAVYPELGFEPQLKQAIARRDKLQAEFEKEQSVRSTTCIAKPFNGGFMYGNPGTARS